MNQNVTDHTIIFIFCFKAVDECVCVCFFVKFTNGHSCSRVADDPNEKQKKETQQPSIPLIDTGIAPSLGYEERSRRRSK